VTKQHIYIYSPSSAVRDKAAVRRGIQRLQAMGHEVEVDPGAFASHMRFAGDDDARLAAIDRACASGADIAIITRGGYGLTRLLPRIRYKAVAKAIDKGTQFVGLSDFTAFQNAVLAETGRVTWSGPAVGEDFGVEGEPDDIMLACFDDLVQGQGEGTGWQLPASERSDSFRAGRGRAVGRQPGHPGGAGGHAVDAAGQGRHPVHRGRARAPVPGRAHAHAVAVRRRAGKQKAIVFGHFTNYKPVPHDKGFKLKTVVDWLRTQVKAPVLTGLPFGHVPTKVLLPVGPRCSWRWKAAMRSSSGGTGTDRRAGLQPTSGLGRDVRLPGSRPWNSSVMACTLRGPRLRHAWRPAPHQVAAQVPQALDVAGIADAARDLGKRCGPVSPSSSSMDSRMSSTAGVQDRLGRDGGVTQQAVDAFQGTLEPAHVSFLFPEESFLQSRLTR
jgi:muramoyltetrapeptide carboxypeptidase